MLAEEKPKREATTRGDVRKLEHWGWISAVVFLVSAIGLTFVSNWVVEGGHTVPTTEARPVTPNATNPAAQAPVIQRQP